MRTLVVVAMVGMNIGAGQERRALRIAFIGGAAAFVITESIGLAAAIWPESWLRLFDTNARMVENPVGFAASGHENCGNLRADGDWEPA